MKRKSILALLLALAMTLSSCGGEVPVNSVETSVPETSPAETASAETTVPQQNTSDTEYFSDRDFDPSYDESDSALIQLNGDSAACSSDAVQISGSTVTITDEGTYILTGTLENGQIIVNADKADKTQLVLDGVDIHSEASAPIYILQADKVFLTLAEGSENTLSNGGTFTPIDENNIDSVIFSKEDLTMNGGGSLTITSPGGHGVVSKDELTLTGGVYTISAASHGMTGKDSVCIANAAFTITSGKDGIHAENDEDASLGYLYIESGTFDVTADGDGLSAAAFLQIEDGDFNITSGGGSENAAQQTSESWGQMPGMGGMPGGGMGGGRGQGGGRGDPGGSYEMTANTQTSSTETEEDSTSIKGIKAGGDLTVNGGVFTIDAADDGVHSNSSITVNGGDFSIATGDDGFHADDTLTITDGDIDITESYEGLEGLHIAVSGGDIALISTDDGMNAAGGNDSSGMGGMRGGDRFSASSDGSILISGGSIYMNASGDGIDANGTLEITDGYVVACGPTSGDTATLDYDISAVISGGTFIGTGSMMMAQTFSDGSQGVIAVSVDSQQAGSEIRVVDASGNELMTYAPELPFAVVIISSPEIVSGDTYTLYVGDLSGEVTAS